MGLRSADIATSKLSPKQRHIQLYKDLHDMFLKQDFVNKADFDQFIVEMNQEWIKFHASVTKELAAIKTDLGAHQHVWSGGNAGGPVGGTTTASTSSYAPALDALSPAVAKSTFVEQRNTLLQALGPAIAPLGSDIA